MHVAITGSSGLVGSALVEKLNEAGHRVTRVVRRQPEIGEMRWDPSKGTIQDGALNGVDAVVNLGGAGIGDKRWTDDYKRELVDSRLRGTKLLAETIAGSETKPTVLLSGSAIGIYGARGDEELVETSELGVGFLAELCEDWEAATAAATAAGVRTVHLRTGIVLSPTGGALKKQLPLFKFGLGGKMGSGKQWQSWVSIDDEVGAIIHLLTSQISGAVNITAPHPVTQGEFAQTLACVLSRPAFLPIPSFGPKILLGAELADNLLFTGQRVLPAALSADGFTFRHRELEPALRELLGHPSR